MSFTERSLTNIRPAGKTGGKKHDFFNVPAYEPAYTFKVEVYYSWRSSHRWLLSQALIDHEFDEVYEIVRRAIRKSIRAYSVFNPARAEDAANADLAAALANAARPGGAIQLGWTAHAEVRPPDEVVAIMRRTLEEEYIVQARAKVSALVMNKTNELRAGWDNFLDGAAMSRNAQHAVRLAEDPHEVAAVLEDVLQERRQGAEELMTLINKIIDAQKAADVFELVVKSETVLRKTLERMGIPLPAAEAGTLLEPLEADS